MRLLMKKFIIPRFLVGLTIVFFINQNALTAGVHALDLFMPEKAKDSGQKFSNTIEEQIQKLEGDYALFQEQFSQPDLKNQLDVVSARIENIKASLQDAPDDNFLNEKLSFANQEYQALIEIQQARKDLLAMLDQHIKLLREYLEAPDFKRLRKELKTYYSFNDLQEENKLLREYQDRLVQTEEKNKANITDIANKKKMLTALETELKEKKRLQEDFLAKSNQSPNGLSIQQKSELLDANVELLTVKKELAQLKVAEAERRGALLDSQLYVLRNQLTLLKSEYARIKRALRVDGQYVQNAKTELEKKRQHSLATRERYEEKTRILTPLQSKLKDELAQRYKKASITKPLDDSALIAWPFAETTTMQAWDNDAQAAKLQAAIGLYEANKEFLKAQAEFEKIKFQAQENMFNTINSWHKMTTRKLGGEDEEEFKKEIKNYEGARAELEAALAVAQERRTLTTNTLTRINEALEQVKNYAQELKGLKVTLFKTNPLAYEETLEALAETESSLRSRSEVTAKLLETNAASIAVITSALNQIDTIVAELNLKDFWQPSSKAIDWAHEIRNFVPDIKLFLTDVRTLATTQGLSSLLYAAKARMQWYQKNPFKLLVTCIYMLLTLFIYFLLRQFLPTVSQSLANVPPVFHGRYVLSLFSKAIIDFIGTHLGLLFGWLVFFILIKLDAVTNVYLVILFYLSSIPFFIVLARRFFATLLAINKEHNNLVLSESYQKRFFTVVPFFCYITIVIMFFRQAFMLGNYDKSHLPTTLLAINYILLQLALLLLMSRGLLLSLIPGKTQFGMWARQQIKNYHYLLILFLGAVIIMSNPYVGFFKQVSYILSRFVLTLISIPMFMWVHNLLKHSSSMLFFYTEGEALKERFPYAKTLYSLFVVTTFLGFVMLSVIIISRVWNYPITFTDIADFFHKPIYSPGIDEVTKQPIQVSAFSLLKVLGYVAGGIAVTFIINSVVLQRLFDLLLVNSGVQDTLLILIRYFIMLTAILLGLQSVGLGSLITYMGLILGLLGFAVKDPISDVICYFVILVQRPIKIGDYIAFDSELMGVVRHITPRSVIVRRKNSVTLVIPNSQFVTKPIVNWNYSRTFFAFNDIYFTIPYSAQPEMVRSVIFKVMETHPLILKNPAPIVWLSDFTENGFLFQVRGFLSPDKTLEQWEISSDVRIRIVVALRENGIDLAVPVRKIIESDSNALPRE